MDDQMWSGQPAGPLPATVGRAARRRLLIAALSATLLAVGAVLMAAALPWSGRGPHAQPLPARLFVIDPAAARTLPQPAALTRPQPGSIEAACAPLPAWQPQVTIRSLCISAPLALGGVVGGDLLIPADVQRVGLDAGSAALGARHGTTIIAGHVDNFTQGDGAFHFLYQVQPGALISVTGLDHKVTTWRAYETAVVAKTALPSGIWSTTGARRLVLVTCGGPLVHTGSGNTYRDNILIYATPANP
jgi:hypothetical protein